MIDGTTTADQAAPETASNEVTQESDELQPHEGQLDGAEGEVEEVVEELDEIEHEGKKYSVPKALKPGWLMQADYTRKTQEVAEQRKAIESEREAFTKSMEVRQQLTKEIGQLQVFDETLEQYQKVDWATWRAQDPDRANAALQDMVLLQQRRVQLAATVESKTQEQSQAAQSDFTKRYNETNATLARDIPGWNESAPKVRDFAIGHGVTADELRIVATNPTFAKILHKAWLGDQIISKQQAAAKAAAAKKPAGETEVKPLTTIGRKPSAAAKPGVHDDLPVDEWVKRERARMQKQRG